MPPGLRPLADRPGHIIVAGKGHPDDEEGKRQVRSWAEFVRQPAVANPPGSLEDDDISPAQELAAAPGRPAEPAACRCWSTSGIRRCGGRNSWTFTGRAYLEKVDLQWVPVGWALTLEP